MDFRIVSLVDQSGRSIGWLIGHAFQTPDGLLKGTATVPCTVSSASFPTAAERWLFDLAGRFAVAIVAGISRFYVDAAASLGAVYSTKAAVVASTTGLIPRRGDTTRHELVALLDIPNKDNWFPFGLTPRADIDRLMASHYLDLELWQPKRCWSCPSPGPADDVPELVERIARRAETTIQLAAAWSPLSINLTAGRDSRMLLACARIHRATDCFQHDAVPEPSRGTRLLRREPHRDKARTTAYGSPNT